MIHFSFFHFLCGCLFGACGFWFVYRLKKGKFQHLAYEIVEKAEREANHIRSTAVIELKEKAFSEQRTIDLLFQEHRQKVAREEERLSQREDKLDTRIAWVEKKLADIEKRDTALAIAQTACEEEKKQLASLQEKTIAALEEMAGLSASQAKELLLERVEVSVRQDAARLTQRLRTEMLDNMDKEATRVIATAIQRLAIPCVSEVAVTSVSLPSEEMKRRIIGREGRNIRALEQLIGVNFLIDDSAVVISGFDPIRRHIAKTVLTELIHDGRIHPTRIEEIVRRTEKMIEKKIKETGEDAAVRAGVVHLHPHLANLLGKLHFRTSFGQNILEHSLEVSSILGLMASELGLDGALARRIGLLHDIGKAISHEKEGSHALVGYESALKYGEKEEVANGIGCHHDEMPPLTVEGSLCSAADAISGGRPGARNEAIEHYFKRLRKLEHISTQFEGVVKAYALQAGHEIRVMVEPDLMDDAAIVNLARNLAQRIEQELSYPGKIKVTVIREKRAIEYAT